MIDLRLSQLREKNLLRLPLFKDRKGRICHDTLPGRSVGHDWALSQWSNALAGEVGEACNLIKKIERGDLSIVEAKEDLANELCDILTYLDLLAHRAGINLAEATINKWNQVSDRIDAPYLHLQED